MRDRRMMLPSSGFSRPAIMLTNVVLPVPFGARMPRELPSSTRNDARSRMTLRRSPVQKDLLTLLNSIMACLPLPRLTENQLFGSPYFLTVVRRFYGRNMPMVAITNLRDRCGFPPMWRQGLADAGAPVTWIPIRSTRKSKSKPETHQRFYFSRPHGYPEVNKGNTGTGR